MVAKFVVEEGALKGLSLSFEEGDTWTIGRDPDECQFVIEDPLVSRKHLIARRTPEGIVIENLSETNPILINDEEIGEHPHLLQNGDTLKVGNEVLRFYEESSAQVHDEDVDHISDFEDIDHPSDEAPQETLPPIESDMPPSDAIEQSHLPPSSLTTPEEKERVEYTIRDDSSTYDTLLGEENDDAHVLANIDFGVIEAGRWLLKVIGGPNNGAEFYMQAGNHYVIGTDPHSCDIIFHDTSVSRQHARITVTPEDTLLIEDLKSRNGVLINGSLIEGQQTLPLSTIVTLGTTSFVVYDREGEMQTIISPLLPSIVKVLQQEPPAEEISSPEPLPAEKPLESQEEIFQPITPPQPHNFGPYIVLTAIVGLFVLAGIGTSTLFHEEPVIMQTQENANELIHQALSPFPSIHWTFNKSNGSLLLLGHVATSAEKSRLVYHLNDLKFIKTVDDSGIIIDEGVLHEVNSLLSNSPEWKGIRVYSPEAGQFILSGTLKTRKQAEQLSSYLSLNFPYLDLLKKQIVVEEDIAQQIHTWLRSAQLPDISVAMSTGEITLTGTFPNEKSNDLNNILAKIKEIPGVRVVSNQTHPQTAETGIIDISDHYSVTGKSRIGQKFTVVINGRILSEGDELDGMTITKISSNHVYLERDKDKFRIDY